ncbi:hypothetical protein L211DRAFT_786381 [Terfezia boudieri ATCC MYA-4762]|uniref:UDP-glucose:glycoprotein glucosyltransferase n=1 Tax=Terfezia boudieri ATCC MYA-4762 TaxID=1051890 RepID=A0A3N4M003_9PEZI|nr:hypothetical protein L211DRAFT_786381 [Terfezia boudieri ATCC MYA-4762]
MRLVSLVASLVVIAQFPQNIVAAPAVTVGLKPSWGAAPFLLELLETAAEEEKDSYFPLLDKIATGEFEKQTTDEALYSRFLQVAQQEGFLTDTVTLSSFNLALSMNSVAPRIEAHYRYYEDTLEPVMGVSYKPRCRVWLQWSQKQHCAKSIESMISTWERFPNDRTELAFDRVLKTKPDVPAAILHADIEDPDFLHFHSILTDFAKRGVLSYRVRYRAPKNPVKRQVLLGGYGAELALKKTDYKVMDDREVQNQNASNEEPVKQEGLADDEEISDIKPLHPKDVTSLGIKAASFIMSSDYKLDSLLRLVQDLPKHSSALSTTEINSALADELIENRDIFLNPGANAIWVNGLQLEDSEINAFALLSTLRRERRFIKKFETLGLTKTQAIELLSHKVIREARQNELPLRFDYRDDIEGGSVIIWLNDLENDERYKGWSTDPKILLRRVYPGQLHQLKRNIHNLVLPLDLTSLEDVSLLTEHLMMFVERGIALRFGIVPVIKSEQSMEQAKLFYYLFDTYGLEPALKYLEKSLEQEKLSKPNKKIFDAVCKESSLKPGKTANSLEDALVSEHVKKMAEDAIKWSKRLGITDIPQVFINGLAVPRTEDWMQQMSGRLSTDVMYLQRKVHEGVAFQGPTSDVTLLDHMLLIGAKRSRNVHIFPEDEVTVNLVDIAELAKAHALVYEKLPALATEQPDKLIDTTVWVVGDFDEKDGYELLRAVAEAQKKAVGISIILINNPELVSERPAFSTLLYQLNVKGLIKTSEQLFQFIELLTEVDEYHDVKSKTWFFNEHIEAGKFWRSCQELLQKAGFKPGQRGLVVNGRVVGPIPAKDDFSAADVKQLFMYEWEKRIMPVLEAADDLGALDNLSSSTNAAILTNLVALTTIPEGSQELFVDPPSMRLNLYDQWRAEHSAIVTGDKHTAIFHIVASIDPTSELAQRYVPILKVLSEMDGVYLRLFLNPERVLNDLTVKRFYRYVLDSKPRFGAEGQLIYPKADFHKMPVDALLTLGLDVPPSWLVTPKVCVFDPDNIQLSSLRGRFRGENLEAIYELRSILIQGHSRDITIGGPPKGAQLVLGNGRDPHFADTIVMANVGYFQFKANPGMWKLSLKDGNSATIFNIDDAGTRGYNNKNHDGNPQLAVVTFQGATIFPRLSRKAGMEAADVLAEPAKLKDTLYYVKEGLRKTDEVLQVIGILKPPKNQVIEKKQADINIFSVASGHLYERFLNIMILSVMKHTDHTVKFWFIDNFLSPSFKDFIPHMAKEYSFEYELITYKWPHWLRGQKEKQREIWGYKILFLDVLFPLDLDKVIFVDADQIVRTDLKELVDLDLQGAPYAFTPMCDSRKEIEGFRFWKQGYWKNFLRGLPYHISALYVVDLKRFRQIAAGDRLRQQYHQLSADPGSLANLDQDLPNHMQQFLPIYSLPQDWLWCETWCSDESLATAKTIDLCNNPMTKEPKLDRARRQVPEWTLYDSEVATLAKRVRNDEESVHHLADSGAEKSKAETPAVEDNDVKDEL